MNKKYIGIDVGKAGFVAVIDDGEYRFCSIEDCDNLSLSKFLFDETLGQSVAVVIEDVHALYGSSANGTFEFGWIKGFLTGLLVAHKIPYTLIQPKEWQGVIWTNADMVVNHKKVTQKNGKVKEKPIPKSAKYKLAGNSIVVSCLYHIFHQMFIAEPPEPKPIQKSLFDL